MIVLSTPPTPIAGGDVSPSSPPGSTPLGSLHRVILRCKFGVPVDNAEFSLCYPVSEEDVHRCSVIKELVRATDGCIDLPLSQCEVRALLDHVCIMRFTMFGLVFVNAQSQLIIC